MKEKRGDGQGPTGVQPKMPGPPEPPAPPAAGAATAQGGASKIPSEDDKVRGALKERVALKEKIKDAQSDLDLLQREYQLDQDSFYSSPDYANNTSGNEKLEAMMQQNTITQNVLDHLTVSLDD